MTILKSLNKTSFRFFADEYESRGLKQGYISYKINTCETPGKRDLSAYAGNA